MIKEADAEEHVIKRGVMYFTIGDSFGELITDIAREKAWNDLKEGDAIIMLIEGLGCDTDQAREIIHGKKKFVTNPDHKTVRLVDDNFTPPDFEGMRQVIKQAIIDAENCLVRAKKGLLYIYMGDIANITAEIQNIKELTKIHIWKAHERAKGMNQWILDIHNRNREDLREKFEDIHAKPLGFPTTKDGPDPDLMEMLKADTKAKILSVPGDPEQKARLLRLVDSQGKDPIIFVDSKFKFDSGWLTREGIYYGCELGLHRPLADKLVEKFFAKEVGDTEPRDTQYFLEEKGWMKCTGGQWFETEKAPTPQQLAAMKKWSEKHKIKEYHERYRSE